MESQYIYLNAEEGLAIGDSLSDQLGCFTVIATAIAITTVMTATAVSIVKLFH